MANRRVSVVQKMEGNKVYITSTTFHKVKEVIDGHFWCETPSGEVYNDFTGEKIINRLLSYQQNRGEIPIYLPANRVDEEKYIKQRLANTEKEYIKNGGKEMYFQTISKLDLQDNDCYFNTILTNFKTGFKIRFGHLGMMKPNGMIYWIFGHPNNTFDDFENDCESNENPKNEGETNYSTHPYLVEKKQKELKKKLDFEEMEMKKKKKIAEQNERDLLAMLEKEDKQKSKKQKSKKNN